MTLNLLTVLELAALCGMVLGGIGFSALFLGSHKARRAFREKGFLRPPSGLGWLRFLLFRQYEYFENDGIRRCFGTSHVCLVAVLFVIGAVALFVGSNVMLSGMGSIDLSGPGLGQLFRK